MCGHCGTKIASQQGWGARVGPNNNTLIAYIYICHACKKPTFIQGNVQIPGVTVGNSVNDITEPMVANLYEEARRTTEAGAYTAAVLCCRKLLMHIAVSKGAPPNDTFANYVNYFADKHFIPPDALSWVDHIRTKSNEANHEIIMMTKEDAEELLSFLEMLLKMIFEFPAAAQRKVKKGA